jgi:hypothetical protein
MRDEDLRADRQFEFADKHRLIAQADDATRASIQQVLMPLRHYEWGANMNNDYVCAYGFGTAITQPCIFAAMDRLGMAQYLSRLGLQLDGNQGKSLAAGKQAWLEMPAWQGVRRMMENLFVTKDWFDARKAQLSAATAAICSAHPTPTAAPAPIAPDATGRRRFTGCSRSFAASRASFTQ